MSTINQMIVGHLNYFNMKSPYKCIICHEHFDKKTTFVLHMRKHAATIHQYNTIRRVMLNLPLIKLIKTPTVYIKEGCSVDSREEHQAPERDPFEGIVATNFNGVSALNQPRSLKEILKKRSTEETSLKKPKVRHKGKVKKYMCTLCLHSTNNRNYFKRHLIKHKLSRWNIKVRDVDLKQKNVVTCRMCGFSTKLISALKSHYSEVPCTKTPLTKKSVKKRHNLKINLLYKWFHCGHCNFTTKYQKYLELHMNKHSPEDTLEGVELNPLEPRGLPVKLSEVKLEPQEDIKVKLEAGSDNLQTYTEEPSNTVYPQFHCVHCPFTTKYITYLELHMKECNSAGDPLERMELGSSENQNLPFKKEFTEVKLEYTDIKLEPEMPRPSCDNLEPSAKEDLGPGTLDSENLPKTKKSCNAFQLPSESSAENYIPVNILNCEMSKNAPHATKPHIFAEHSYFTNKESSPTKNSEDEEVFSDTESSDSEINLSEYLDVEMISEYEANVFIHEVPQAQVNIHPKNTYSGNKASESLENSAADQEKGFKCEKCDFATNFMKYLELHMEKHKGLPEALAKETICDLERPEHIEDQTVLTKGGSCSSDTPINLVEDPGDQQSSEPETNSAVCMISQSAVDDASNDLSNSTNNASQDPQDLEINQDKNFQCSPSTSATNIKKISKFHIEKHNHIPETPKENPVEKEKKNFECDKCAFTTNFMRYLEFHMEKHKIVVKAMLTGNHPTSDSKFEGEVCKKLTGSTKNASVTNSDQPVCFADHCYCLPDSDRLSSKKQQSDNEDQAILNSNLTSRNPAESLGVQMSSKSEIYKAAASRIDVISNHSYSKNVAKANIAKECHYSSAFDTTEHSYCCKDKNSLYITRKPSLEIDQSQAILKNTGRCSPIKGLVENPDIEMIWELDIECQATESEVSVTSEDLPASRTDDVAIESLDNLTVDQDKGFKCDKCKFATNFIEYLNLHMKKHNNGSEMLRNNLINSKKGGSSREVLERSRHPKAKKSGNTISYTQDPHCYAEKAGSAEALDVHMISEFLHNITDPGVIISDYHAQNSSKDHEANQRQNDNPSQLGDSANKLQTCCLDHQIRLIEAEKPGDLNTQVINEPGSFRQEEVLPEEEEAIREISLLGKCSNEVKKSKKQTTRKALGELNDSDKHKQPDKLSSVTLEKLQVCQAPITNKDCLKLQENECETEPQQSCAKNGADSNVFRCKHCNFITKFQRYIVLHENKHSQNGEKSSSNITSIGLNATDKCKPTTSDQLALELQKCQKQQALVIQKACLNLQEIHLSSNKDINKSKEEDDRSKTLQCKYCKFKTKFEEYMELHEKKHQAVFRALKKIRPYKCETCDFSTHFSGFFQAHLNKHTSPVPQEMAIS